MSSTNNIRRWTEQELIARYGKMAEYYENHEFVPEDSDGFLDVACTLCASSADSHPKERNARS